MSGIDVRSSKRPDAQQNVPTGAESAPVAADGRGSEGCGAGGEVRWVGQQQLMHGYCGRATANASAAATASATASASAPPVTPPLTPHRRPRDLVVRIGPKVPAESAGPLARAA